MSPRERNSLLTAFWLCCVAFLCTLAIADPDLWGHTLYGLRARRLGQLVEPTDPFSYTAAGAVWINHEWLTEYLFGWLWQSWGNPGLCLWRNFWVAVVFAAAALAHRRGESSVAAAVAVWVFSAEGLSEFVVFIRPQLATFGLFAVSLLILRTHWDQPHRRDVWLLPVLTAFWTNLHGGFLAGLGLQGVFLAGWFLRCLHAVRQRGSLRDTHVDSDLRGATTVAVVSVASGLATLVNPYGWRLHVMLWDHLITTQVVREWQGLWEAQQSPIYYVPYALMAIAVMGRRRVRWIDLAVLLVVTYQAVSHIRHTALLAITVMILLPAAVGDGLQRMLPHIHQQWAGESRRAWRMTAAAACLAIMFGLQGPSIATLWRNGVSPWTVGVEAVSDIPGVPLRHIAWLKSQQIEGNILTDYGWGQCVIWHLFPGSRVAFDGRYRTIYSTELEQALIEFQRTGRTNPRSTPLLDDYPTQIVLLPAERGPVSYMRSRADWVAVAEDDQAVLFLRRGAFPLTTDLPEAASWPPLPEVPRWSLFPGLQAPSHHLPASATAVDVTRSRG